MVEVPCADSEEKREPVGDIDTALVEADIDDGCRTHAQPLVCGLFSQEV